jgi:putative ABC transport system substrate-binding protein
MDIDFMDIKIKEIKMKKCFFVMVMVLALIAPLVLSGCEKDKRMKIGIAKIVDHPALNALEQGVLDFLNEAGVDALYDMQNANGDPNTASQIASQFENERVKVAIGIATPIAVALAVGVTDIPVVFAAVTDPVSAGLVDDVSRGLNNVTGMSDAISVPTHLALFKEVANIKTLGYIYTSNEANSVKSLADVQAVCIDFGIELIAQAISTSSDVKQAAQAIISRVDGIYITSDNTVYSALPSLFEVCHDAKKPLFSVDVTSCKEGGAMIASGFNYYKAGRATGEMVFRILNGTPPADIPVKFMTEPGDVDLLFDLDEAAACGIVIPPALLNEANFIIKDGILTERDKIKIETIETIEILE